MYKCHPFLQRLAEVVDASTFESLQAEFGGSLIYLPRSAQTGPKRTRPATPERVKHEFSQRGITFTDWARDNGYTRNEVYRVLNGQAKCYYGKAHEIAVKLGLKPDEERLSA